MKRYNKTPIIALIYDFDGTLSPGNMQEFGFIQAIGQNVQEFWNASDSIAIEHDASNILAYMKHMVDEAHRKNIKLKREDFLHFGSLVQLFPGVTEWFDLINEYGKSKGVIIEHYINSSGLAEMVEGSTIASKFKKIFASTFIYDENGEATWPGVAVDYTAKTQFLFKINKGILSIRDSQKVNESQAEEKKRIPWAHMIYFGDGDTDVPCMKIVKMFGGNPIAVYNPDKPRKIETARRLFKEERVSFIAPTDYRESSRTYEIVKAIIDKIVADNVIYRLKKTL